MTAPTPVPQGAPTAFGDITEGSAFRWTDDVTFDYGMIFALRDSRWWLTFEGREDSQPVNDVDFLARQWALGHLRPVPADPRRSMLGAGAAPEDGERHWEDARFVPAEDGPAALADLTRRVAELEERVQHQGETALRAYEIIERTSNQLLQTIRLVMDLRARVHALETGERE